MISSASTMRLALIAVLGASLASALIAPARLPALSAARPARSGPAPLAMSAGDFNENGMRKFRWNLNSGREPWGMSLNAEVWNGRMAMMGFVLVSIQEVVMGEGVITKVQNAKSIWDVAPIYAGFALGAAAVLAVVAKVGSDDDDAFDTDELVSELRSM